MGEPLTIVPNILHTIHLGILKHLMDSVTSFLKQHSRIGEFNQLSVMMPPYPGFARCNKPYSQVTEWCSKEMKALWRLIFPLFAATLLNPSGSQKFPFTEALVCIENLVYFHRMAQYRYLTEVKIKKMENYLDEFQCHKHGFRQFRASKSTQKVSEAWKTQLTLNTQEERQSYPAWNWLSAAAKRDHVVAGKCISRHHRHSACQRTEQWLVCRDPMMTEMSSVRGVYGDTGVAKMNGAMGSIYLGNPGVHRLSSHLII